MFYVIAGRRISDTICQSDKVKNSRTGRPCRFRVVCIYAFNSKFSWDVNDILKLLLKIHIYTCCKMHFIATRNYWHVSEVIIFTARNEVGPRLYLHRRLWFCSQGNVCVLSQHALQVVSQHALQQVSGVGGRLVSQHALHVSRPTPKGEV